MKSDIRDMIERMRSGESFSEDSLRRAAKSLSQEIDALDRRRKELSDAVIDVRARIMRFESNRRRKELEDAARETRSEVARAKAERRFYLNATRPSKENGLTKRQAEVLRRLREGESLRANFGTGSPNVGVFSKGRSDRETMPRAFDLGKKEDRTALVRRAIMVALCEKGLVARGDAVKNLYGVYWIEITGAGRAALYDLEANTRTRKKAK